ncbi:MAG: LPS export ABC transporter permease LptF [Succinivibrionaceae bacterium]|nr:LPS export ABC transporter permease LptF [Succinivibrionaceae bacterium]
MIIRGYLLKEIFKSQMVTMVVLMTVFVSQSIIKYVSRASTGSIPVDLISSMVVYSLPEIATLMLPLTLFIAILTSIGRICSDSEMVVMRSTGFSPQNVLFIAAVLAVGTAAVALVSSAVLEPMAAARQVELRASAQNNPEYLPLESGKFLNFEAHTIYIEKVDSKGGDAHKDISRIYSMTSPGMGVPMSAMVARDGFVEIDEDGVQWLALKDGIRAEGPLEDRSFRLSRFESAYAPISRDPEQSRKVLEIYQTPTLELMEFTDPLAIAELQWRFAPLFACLILPMIAVPLSMVNPRQGRFARLFPAILIYASYYLALLAVRSMVGSGSFPSTPGLFVVPGAFLICLAIPLNTPMRRRRPAPAKGKGGRP